jgi:hypothetical protein
MAVQLIGDAAKCLNGEGGTYCSTGASVAGKNTDMRSGDVSRKFIVFAICRKKLY